jgi:hypothetical protein
LKAAVRADQQIISSPADSCLRDRVRLAVHGRELIDWHYNDSFASFLAMFDVIDLQNGDASQMKEGALYANGLPEMMRMHAKHRTSHVLITPLSQNWGAFSTTVPNRTVDWGDWRTHLARAGCSPEMIRMYLDDPAVKAVLATQHTTIYHPKIVSVPVGVPRGTAAITRHLETAEYPKTQDLLINNSGWGHRTEVNERVSANFGGRVRNTFGCPQSEYFASVTRSRFVLCPSGFGWDNYRIWETLTLGSIPVLEYSRGFHTVLDDLPVLWVEEFDKVTPALLESAYPDILSRCDLYDYGRLTRQWWVSRVASLLHTTT